MCCDVSLELDFVIKKLAVLLLANALVACAAFETSEATHILSGEAYPPVSEDAVVIYIQKPTFDYLVVGLVEARGMGFTDEARDQELAIEALKSEAASIGANGVIIGESNQEIVGITKYGTNTERRIKGIAIRRP
jgi:hypothetical protein